MRRLTLVLAALAVAGVTLYRRRAIERYERELAIGRHADDSPA